MQHFTTKIQFNGDNIFFFIFFTIIHKKYIHLKQVLKIDLYVNN